MWLLIALIQLLVVDLPHPLVLGQDAVEITLIAPGDTDLRRQMAAVAADSTRNLVLRLHGVEADGDPGVSWAVYVASADPADSDNIPTLAGILSLYGAPPSAELVVPLDTAVLVGKPAGLKVVFRPISGLEVDDDSVPPKVLASVRVAGIRLETDEAPAL
jgi:hypothetical protein